MEHEKQREKLIELIVNAKRADPETGSFTEFLADFLLGYGVFVPHDDYDLDRLRELMEADPADVVPVVRCKDCKHWKPGDFMAGNDIDHMYRGGGCSIRRFSVFENDFCSAGAKMDGGKP